MLEAMEVVLEGLQGAVEYSVKAREKKYKEESVRCLYSTNCQVVLREGPSYRPTCR